MLYLISRAFAFGGVRHPELTPFLRWGPLLSASVLTAMFWLLPIQPKLTGDGSLSRHMMSVFGILPGFFIAAIAAVATFNRPEIDEAMPDPAPKIKLRTGGEDEFVDLTMRMFTSHLFSYLTALSFLAVFTFLSADLISPSVYFMVNKVSDIAQRAQIYSAMSILYVWMVAWFASKIILTTLVGLYFLAERMHRPNA